MKYHDQESAFGAMIETAVQEFEENLRLPHLTLCVNGATGEYRFLRGAPVPLLPSRRPMEANRPNRQEVHSMDGGVATLL